ncbi:MAG TPA: sigma-70 family RNA polymerase sigma factor, partial [Solirubrobacteraceae bacterium]|nr:sigma-70 family RNA polymerase sigma factor [Solirubrobacteraceae bacterium]
MRADHDTVLARRAAAGDAAAFALLYDRHERRAYNLCYRITGSADDAADATQETFLKVLERLPGLADRELNFGSYLLTAARHASYDAIERRKRALPSGDIPESAVPPAAAADEPALLAAHQEQIRAANALLPTRQREVLALRELEELSYDEVAEIMGMNRNSVAQLISRARLNLRDALRRGALGAIPAASPDCEAALPLLALAQDNGLDDAARADWLAGHLAGCATCRVRVEAMEEAGAAYRLWLPLAPAAWLRSEVAEAADGGMELAGTAGRKSSYGAGSAAP